MKKVVTHQDNIVRVAQGFNGLVHTGLSDLAFNLVVRLSRRRANSTEQHVRERPVHCDALG